MGLILGVVGARSCRKIVNVHMTAIIVDIVAFEDMEQENRHIVPLEPSLNLKTSELQSPSHPTSFTMSL